MFSKKIGFHEQKVGQENPQKQPAPVAIKRKNKPQAYWMVYEPQQKSIQNINITHCQQQSSNTVDSTSKQLHNQSITKLTNILSYLSTSYATYRFLNHLTTSITVQAIEQIIRLMQVQFQKYKLTKRNLVFAILIPSTAKELLQHIKTTSYFIQFIHFYQRQITQPNNQPLSLHQKNLQLHQKTPQIHQKTPQIHRKPSQQQSPTLSPNSSPRKLMKLSRKASFLIGDQVYMNLRKQVDQISQELIKVMKLDFIWLGVMSRLGTSVSKFQQILIEQQNFDPQYIGVYDNFFEQLNNLIFNRSQQQINNKNAQQQLTNFIDTIQLSSQTIEASNNTCNNNNNFNNDDNNNNNDSKNKNKEMKVTSSQHQQIRAQQLKQLLQQSLSLISCNIPSLNSTIQQLIRSKFNSRVIFSDILLFGDYLPLLLSRNYFNLLYIQTSTLQRYQQFKLQCLQKYPLIADLLTLENFLIIDDYWYRNFILKSLPNVKFIIDKATSTTSYQQIVNSINISQINTEHYKQIIPPYRPTFDQYFLSVCYALKQRSACLKEAVGSIIVKDKRIISTGYNGTPVDCINCFNGGCKVCNNSEKMSTEVLSCTCIHAEYGCILQAGIKVTPGATLYSTKLPCLWCCKLIIQGKISKIVYLKSTYPHLQYENIALVKEILQKAKIELLEVEQTKIFTSL